MEKRNWKIKGGCLNFSENVSSIMSGAFSSFGLIEVNISKNIKDIGDFSFIGNDLLKLNISNGVKRIGNNAFSCNQISNVHIPSSVKTIEKYAFYKNRLSNIELSDGLVTIGEYAFNSNKIKEVLLPDSVSTIGKHAFDEIDVVYKNNLLSKDLIHKYGTENIVKITKLLEITSIDTIKALPYEALSEIPVSLNDIKNCINNMDNYSYVKGYILKNKRSIDLTCLYKLCYILGLFDGTNKESVINFIDKFSDNIINESMSKVSISTYKKDVKELIFELLTDDKLVYKNELIIGILYSFYETIKNNTSNKVSYDVTCNYIDDNNLLILDERKDSSYNVNLVKKKRIKK